MKKKLEIGCGNNRREEEGFETVAVDLIKSSAVDIVCNLGFEKLNLEDNIFDRVNSYDVLEHIPTLVWLGKNQILNDGEVMKHVSKDRPTSEEEFKIIKKNLPYQTTIMRLTPFIFLMNEVFRVMKHGAIFYIETPRSDQGWFRDPTHCNRITEETWHYFSKKDNLYAEQGLITANFELVKQEYREYKWTAKDIMCTTLKAVKQITEVQKDKVLI